MLIELSLNFHCHLLVFVRIGDFSVTEIEGLSSTENAEVLTVIGLEYLEETQKSGVRIVQEKAKEGGDEIENATEAAMEDEECEKVRVFEDLMAREKTAMNQIQRERL